MESPFKIIPLDEYEFHLEVDGMSLHICLGKHVDGNYIAIPNWGVCSEASDWSDTFWNTEQLRESKSELVQRNAKVIAQAIKHYTDNAGLV
jgi:hypothetical protein